MGTRSSLLRRVTVVALVAVAGCQDKPAPKPESTTGADAGPPHAAGVDKNIEEAVAAVAGGQSAQSGPPQTGVFGAGAADHEMKAGDPPKIVVGSKGSGPTVQFGASSAAAGKKVPGKVEVGIQMGPRSAMPTVDFLLALEGESAAAADSTAPLEVDAKVVAARPAQEQPGQLPPGTDQQIAKARGSRIKFEVPKSGGARITGVDTSKDLDPTFVEILKAAAGVVEMGLLPYPADPVGVGAFWMVTSRESFAGLDVVVYRMFKLDKIEGGHVTLTVSAKRITAGGQIGFGLPPHHVEAFNGNTTAQFDVLVADPSTVQGEAIDILAANLVSTAGNDQAPAGQKLAIQLQIHERLSLGK